MAAEKHRSSAAAPIASTCCMLHNPDEIGYTSEAVWEAMAALKDSGLTDSLGIAPGPANGFTLDLIDCFEKFGELIDWAMLILNPLEPWPEHRCLAARPKSTASRCSPASSITAAFSTTIWPPVHVLSKRDHRAFRPAGWVEPGREKSSRMRPIASDTGSPSSSSPVTGTSAQAPSSASSRPSSRKPAKTPGRSRTRCAELAALPAEDVSREGVEEIRRIGDNTGCMTLKGASPDHEGDALPDRWALDDELAEAGARWNIDPERDLRKLDHPVRG